MVEDFVSKIVQQTSRRTEGCALHMPSLRSNGVYSAFTYRELGWSIEGYRTELAIAGLQEGARILVVLPICFEMYSTILAILSAKMTVVFFDRGLSLSQINALIADANVQGLLLPKKRRWMKHLMRNIWRAKECQLGQGLTLFLRKDITPRSNKDEALITFTSGTTGKPKGANRTHTLLSHQHAALANNLPESSDEVDMSCFPVFLLHNLGSGLTAVFPKLSVAKVSKFDPEVLCKQIAEYEVTRLSGAPAFLHKLCSFIVANKIELPSLRTVLVGGAPVPQKLCRLMQTAFPDRQCWVVYGSTEAEPIAHANIEEVLQAQGEGYFVGKPVDEVEFRITKLPPPHSLNEDYILNNSCAPMEVGEVMVKGPHVLQNYIDNHPDNAATKIPSRRGGIWHRTGDLAYLDAEGHIWLQGRASQVVASARGSVYPFQVEAKVNNIESVSISALTQIDQKVYLAYQGREETEDPAPEIKKILISYGLEYAEIKSIKSMPVDARHNSKVDRQKLAKIITRRWF
ncbi:MAG: AMP-binding protein [Oligoflexales bacterium]